MPANRSYIAVAAIMAGLAGLVGAVPQFSSSVVAQTPGWSTEVYYQVTYGDGSVRDLNIVPRTRLGIRRVVRISRRDKANQNYEMLATGPRPLTVINPGETIRNELAWNGKAWVAGAQTGRRRREADKAGLPELLNRERTRISRILKMLRGRLKDRDRAVAEARRKLALAKRGDGHKAAAEALLAKAKKDRRVLLESIEFYELQIKALSAAARAKTASSRPAGKRPSPGSYHGQAAATSPAGQGTAPGQGTDPGQGAKPKPALGLAGEIHDVGTVPYKVQVWKLPPGRGRRSYSVSMAHAEAGPFGAFHYVAYADTDGDGLPDRLIGRSPLVTASAAGDWTGWQFTTDQQVVFVGNAWTNPDTTIYLDQAGTDRRGETWRGLSNDVYVSGFFGGVPSWQSPFGPYLTNIRVNVSNPFGPTNSPRAEILIR